jgi:4-hydroxybenzoate polyprenyltransferase
VLLWLYPFAKRFTDFPQVILGVQMGLGYPVGMTAMGFDPSRLLEPENAKQVGAIGAFYMANVCWVIVYDTIYAHQDLKDDISAGVKSMAVRFQHHSKLMLTSMCVMEVLLLLASGILCDFGRGYTAFACGGVWVSLVYMVSTVNLEEATECLWWFKNGCWLVAGSISKGLVAEFLEIR